MPSQHQAVTRDAMFGGVDTTTRPHLVADDTWITAHNLVAVNTLFQQVPQKVILGTVAGPVLAMLTIPSINGSSSLVVLTGTTAQIIKLSSSVTSETMYLENYPTGEKVWPIQ